MRAALKCICSSSHGELSPLLCHYVNTARSSSLRDPKLTIIISTSLLCDADASGAPSTASTTASIKHSFPPLSELRQHPAFNTALWDMIPHQSGLLPVAASRGGALRIAWEVHGNGPIKIFLICGLGLTKASYQRQTLYFGHTHGDKYSVLLLENRGVGGSDKPFFRWYSTSEMARDAIEVLDHLGWGKGSEGEEGEEDRREIHVMGISMGGMIAQEMAYLIPSRIASLGLVSTSSQFKVDASASTIAKAAEEEEEGEEEQAQQDGQKSQAQKGEEQARRQEETSTHANAQKEEPKISWLDSLYERFAFILPKSIEQSTQYVALRIYTPSWLFQPDDCTPPSPSTPMCNPPPASPNNPNTTYGVFPSNYARCLAQDVLRRETPPFSHEFSRLGFYAQMFGAGLHRKSDEQLREIAEKVGRERIWIMHGDRDAMIDVSHGRKLMDVMQPAWKKVERGVGHGPIVEIERRFNSVLEERVKVGEDLCRR